MSLNDDLVARYGGGKRKIFVIGGSYPGAMAAWFRYKFPHIADGALASSAVVNAVKDFWRFDFQMWVITTIEGPECYEGLSDLTQHIDGFIDAKDDASL
jgi:predicted peptidase